MRRLLHTVEEDDIPIFLCENLHKKKNGKRLPLHINGIDVYTYLFKHVIGKTFFLSKRGKNLRNVKHVARR